MHNTTARNWDCKIQSQRSGIFSPFPFLVQLLVKPQVELTASTTQLIQIRNLLLAAALFANPSVPALSSSCMIVPRTSNSAI